MSAQPLDLKDDLDERICADVALVFAHRAEIKLREVLLEVIDEGQSGIPWAIDHPFEGVANDARLDFCDAVIERLRRKR